jgi:hypothetical protein
MFVTVPHLTRRESKCEWRKNLDVVRSSTSYLQVKAFILPRKLGTSDKKVFQVAFSSLLKVR